MTHQLDSPPARRGLRIILGFVTLAVLIAPTGYVFSSYWAVTGADQTTIAAERRAVRYLKPLMHLVVGLAEAQSAAVAGKPGDPHVVREAVSKVAAADRHDGVPLGARERWLMLRADIESVLARQPTGDPAYHRYSELTAQSLALVEKVADGASLGTDAEFGAYQTVLQLPALVVHSGHVPDLLRAAGGPTASNDHAGDSRVAPAARTAVVLDRVSAARDVIREDLRRVSSELVTGTAGLDALDELSTAVDALLRVAAPAAAGGQVAPDSAADASKRVRQAARTFSDQLLGALGSQLEARDAELGDQRFTAAAAMLTGLLLATVLLWLTLPGYADRRSPPTAEPTRQAGFTGYPERPGAASPGMVDVADLLTAEELLHVGRAVRSTRGEPGDGVG